MDVDLTGNPLRHRGRRPFAPVDVGRAVLLVDDGLYEALVAEHGADSLHRAGVWRLLRHEEWTEQAGRAATALRGMLGTVRHPLARVATAALSEGIALARLAAPRWDEQDLASAGVWPEPGTDAADPESSPGRHAA